VKRHIIIMALSGLALIAVAAVIEPHEISDQVFLAQGLCRRPSSRENPE
jgi:hypothetical protein